MEKDIIIGLINHNQEIVKEINRLTGVIKSLSERLTMVEADLIEMRKKSGQSNSSPSVNNMPGQVAELQNTKAFNHLRGLGVLS